MGFKPLGTIGSAFVDPMSLLVGKHNTVGLAGAALGPATELGWKALHPNVHTLSPMSYPQDRPQTIPNQSANIPSINIEKNFALSTEALGDMNQNQSSTVLGK